MWTTQHRHAPCDYCGRGLMPISSMDWDGRRYHKRCFKKIEQIKALARRNELELEAAQQRSLLLERLKPSIEKVKRMDYSY